MLGAALLVFPCRFRFEGKLSGQEQKVQTGMFHTSDSFVLKNLLINCIGFKA
jgi:hypothetical protein